MESELAWVDELKERGPIGEIHAALTEQLEGWPAAFPSDVTHDLNVARFLRGSGHVVEKVVPIMVKAARYRKDFIESHAAVRDMREAIGDGTFADASLLPHFHELEAILPMRCVRGTAGSDLPIAVSPVRQLAVDAAIDADLDAKIDLFFRSVLEQRALVLHNLSLQHSRMIKFVEIRDFNGARISELLSKGRPLLGKMKTLLGQLLEFYPEVVHRVQVTHAPTAFSGLYALISPVLNERMRAKVTVLPSRASFAALAQGLDALGVHSWHALLERTVDWSREVQIDAGVLEPTTRWLEAGDVAEWTIVLTAGADVTVRTCFLPQAEGAVAQGGGADEKSEVLEAGETCRGQCAATGAGVLWLCLDNVSSWFKAKTVRATIVHTKAGLAAAPAESSAAAVDLW